MNELNKAIFSAKIDSSGKLQIYNLEILKKLFSSSKGWEGTITFNTTSRFSTDGLEKLYNWWLNIFRENTGSTVEELDNLFRSEFLSDIDIIRKKSGLVSISELDYIAVKDFLLKVKIWAADNLEIVNLPDGGINF